MVVKIITRMLLPTVCILSFSGSCARHHQIAEVKGVRGVEVPFSKTMKPDCPNPKQRVSADDVIHDWGTLTYPAYLIQTRYRTRLPAGTSSPSVGSSYIVVRHNKKIVANFDAGIDSPLGNRTGGGWFSLLNNGIDQLVISQDISRTGAQWVADFSKGFRIIFNGQRFGVGREAEDMTMSDLDGDGIFEITVPLTAFYGFEHSRLTTAETPLPVVIFKYDARRREYFPANPHFKACLLKSIEGAERNMQAESDPHVLGRLMSIVLDYVLVGEEQRGWSLFAETYKLPDQARIKAGIKKELRQQPVYVYLQRSAFLEKRRTAIRKVDFANLTYPAKPIYAKRGFRLRDGSYKGRPGIPGARYPWGLPYPVSLAAIEYGDVTGDHNEEAMVVLSESVAGSAAPLYIYIYTLGKNRPKPLWAVAGGDRAEGGLRKVYSENGELVIELYGRGARVNGDVFVDDGHGACCPHSVTRTRYRWKGNHFAQHGKSAVFPYEGGGASLEMEYRKPD